MSTTTVRRPILVRDVARSYLSLGIGFLCGVGALYATASLAPSVLRGVELADLIRLVYYSLWTMFCIVYIALSLTAFIRLDAPALRSVTAATYPGGSLIRRAWWAFNGGGALVWALTGAGVTIYTLIEAALSGDDLPNIVLIACVAVVVATIALTIVAFAVNYARDDAVFGGLRFPGHDEPRFGDYLYLSIQLTTTFGGSDVEITQRRMRRLASAHSLIAFTFNTVIVALLVSVLVGRLE